MKKLILLLVITFSISIVSCSKDDDGKKTNNTEKPDTPQGNTETPLTKTEKELIGIWTIEAISTKYASGLTAVSMFNDCTKNSSLNFDANKKYTSIEFKGDDAECLQTTLNGNWKLTEDKLTYGDDDYNLTLLTENELHLIKGEATSDGKIKVISYIYSKVKK